VHSALYVEESSCPALLRYMGDSIPVRALVSHLLIRPGTERFTCIGLTSLDSIHICIGLVEMTTGLAALHAAGIVQIYCLSYR
jgi:hypothetical protein